MYKKILVPVDLEHAGAAGKALQIAADLAKIYNAVVTYVGVTPEAPSAVAHTPEEYGRKLQAFGEEQARSFGHHAEVKAYTSHDPAVDLNHTLLKAIDNSDADLVVMASHIPTFADHLRQTHGGSIAARAHVSVLVVR